MNDNANCSINNICKLEGGASIVKATPFGLQHILAMFVSSPAPIIVIAGAVQPAPSQAQTAILLQNTIFAAGTATMTQLYPIWQTGSKLPVVMGVNFTFVIVLSTIATSYGYPVVVEAVPTGGIFRGALELLAKYWRRIITPMMATSVVTAIGFFLLTVSVRSFNGGYTDDFGSAQNLTLDTITLLTCFLRNIFAEGYLKQLSALARPTVGHIVTIFLGKVDLSLITSSGVIPFPHLLPFMPEFHVGATTSAYTISLVSAIKTIGDTSALVPGGLNCEITGKEMFGPLAYDGYAPALSTIFGRPPVASFPQNVGLVVMTKVVDRLMIIIGAAYVILAGLLPPMGNSFTSLPQAVLGGCTIMMFGIIPTSDIQVIAKYGFSQRNIVIISLSLAVGISFTTVSEIGTWDIFPELVQYVFSANVVTAVSVVSVFLSPVLSKDMDTKTLER